jgi:NADH dehydrogenase
MLGESVITLTGHPGRSNEFGASVEAFRFQFDDPDAMAESLSGIRVPFNTYWIRFDHGKTTYDRAVANTRALIRAAEIAGVERVVHISITNPDPKSPLPYFRGKALLEEEIRKGRFSYAIVRPTVVFGVEDILINNIAFLLRKLPFEELVRLLAKAVRSRAVILHGSPRLALAAAHVLGAVFHDVMLTGDELEGPMPSLLISGNVPTGLTRPSRWLTANAVCFRTESALSSLEVDMLPWRCVSYEPER